MVIDTKAGLRDVAKKLLILYAPWPSWTVSGSCVVGTKGSPAVGKITESDDAGREILSYVPLSLVADFLSEEGQTCVSSLKPHQTFSVFINDLDDPPDHHRDDRCEVIPRQSPS